MYVGLIASILWYILDIWFIYEILICMWMMRSCLLLWKRCRGPPAGSLCTLYNLKNLHIFPHSLMILIFKYFLVDRFGEQVLFNDWFLFRPSLRLRGAAKKKNRFFLGDLSQIWVGGVADSQTRSKPLKTPPNHPENRIFRPEFHLSLFFGHLPLLECQIGRIYLLQKTVIIF